MRYLIAAVVTHFLLLLRAATQTVDRAPRLSNKSSERMPPELPGLSSKWNDGWS
jgi:hypothetical protein